MTLKIATLALLFATTSVSAGVIHKWVDDKGVTHYSDEAPQNAETQSTQIDIPETVPTEGKSTDNYYSIANQWARLHKESLEREKLRVQAEQAKASKKASVTNVYVEESDRDGYALVYGKPYYKKHYYKKHYHKKKKRAHNPGYTYRYYQSKYPPGLHPGRRAITKALGKAY